MRDNYKLSSLILPFLLVTAPITLASCQTTHLTSPYESVMQIENANFKEGFDKLYNAKTRFEYPDAIKRLEAAQKTNPSDADTKFHLSYAYLKRSKRAEAKALLDELQKDSSSLSKSHTLWQTAMMANIEDRTKDEIEAWKRVVKNVPHDRWAWYELSSAQSSYGKYTDAAISAKKALQIEPDPSKWESSWIYYLLSKAYYRSGQAEAGIEAARKGEPNKTTWRSTYFRQSLAELKAGKRTDHEKVVAEYIDVSNKEGRNRLGYTYTNVALFYHELGDLENAELYARKGLALTPKGYQNWALGFALADNGKADEALELLGKAAEEYPTNNYVQAAKGWAEYRLGRYEEAQATFDIVEKVSKRRNYSLEGMAQHIDKAVKDPNAAPAPQIPWLG